jgi:hypothetical protein
MEAWTVVCLASAASLAILVFMEKQVIFDGPTRQALRIVEVSTPQNFPSSKNSTVITVERRCVIPCCHSEKAIYEGTDAAVQSWGPGNRRLETGEKVRIDKHRFWAF